MENNIFEFLSENAAMSAIRGGVKDAILQICLSRYGYGGMRGDILDAIRQGTKDAMEEIFNHDTKRNS